jgi:hypothetical protein
MHFICVIFISELLGLCAAFLIYETCAQIRVAVRIRRR